VHFGEGGSLLLLGRPVTLRLRTNAGATRLADEADAAELHLALPPLAGENQVRDAVHAWLKAEARRVLGSRLQCWPSRQAHSRARGRFRRRTRNGAPARTTATSA